VVLRATAGEGKRYTYTVTVVTTVKIITTVRGWNAYSFDNLTGKDVKTEKTLVMISTASINTPFDLKKMSERTDE
jgi:hypothetical protein